MQCLIGLRVEVVTDGLTMVVSRRICRTGGKRLVHILGEGPAQRKKEVRITGGWSQVATEGSGKHPRQRVILSSWSISAGKSGSLDPLQAGRPGLVLYGMTPQLHSRAAGHAPCVPYLLVHGG